MKILILEDSDLRIDFLKGVVGQRAEIFWAQNVSQFIDMLKEHSKIDLFILDHDLGEFDCVGYTCAKGGENGMQAIPFIPESSNCLVWSANIDKSKIMAENLAQKGCAIVRIPFLNKNKPDLVRLFNDFLGE